VVCVARGGWTWNAAVVSPDVCTIRISGFALKYQAGGLFSGVLSTFSPFLLRLLF
jgi:hypothetical protein